MYFAGYDPAIAPELTLWSSDLGGATAAVEDTSGPTGKYPNTLTNIAGSLYFSANDGVTGEELWRLVP